MFYISDSVLKYKINIFGPSKDFLGLYIHLCIFKYCKIYFCVTFLKRTKKTILLVKIADQNN